eukprot:COSAG05_NODE_24462_length_251_cov_0.684211_2_plen_32_part_01
MGIKGHLAHFLSRIDRGVLLARLGSGFLSLFQ